LFPETGDAISIDGDASETIEISGVARELLKIVPLDRPINLDQALETLEAHSSSELIAALFELEMLGLVRQLPGKNFVKVW